MSYVILCAGANSEFDYQALDYYRLFNAGIESGAVEDENILKYIGDPRKVDLGEVKNSNLLAFRPLTASEVKTIDESNKIICFSAGDLHPGFVVTGHAVDCFVSFGNRSAYKTANILKQMGINRPVYKVFPWVDTIGIKKHDNIPFGKVSSEDDMGLRSALRLMASKALVVVPNKSPFTDIIVDGWNGVIFRRDIEQLDESKWREIRGTLNVDDARKMVETASEMVERLLEKNHYRKVFADSIIEGHGFDHNEPWISIKLGKGHRWITPNKEASGGEIIQTPAEIGPEFKVMNLSTLEGYLDRFANMRFEDVHIFDAIVESMDGPTTGKINRLISMLGDRIKKIYFCLDEPPEWAEVSSRLIFIPVSEGLKQVS
jgi:hypothetical protein